MIGREVLILKRQEIERKREKEQQVVEEMIHLYCRKNHKEQFKYRTLCPECQKLLDYARARSARCPFMKEKTFCSNCKVHCYKPEMRKKIREVMGFSGPRMLLYHPGMALWHLVRSTKEKRRKAV